MKRRGEIESEAERAAAIMRTHESAKRMREEEDGRQSERRKMEREREREKKPVTFHL